MRIDYYEINKRAVDLILSAKNHVSLIEPKLKTLIEIRVSQINGCAFCVDMHTAEARQHGENQQRLDCLPVWKESGLFSENEMIAIEWAENVTKISTEPDINNNLKYVLDYYSEAEVVDITLVVALMNALNRLAISFGDKPEKRKV